MNPESRPDLSIVVATYNRRDAIEQLLRKLETLKGPPFEVIVAIDGGSDDTAAVVDAARVSYPVRWVDTHETGYGLAVARNAGILEARGRVVVVMDDDGVPLSNFVEAHVSSAKLGVITGGPRDPSDSDQSVFAQRMRDKMSAMREIPELEPMLIAQLRHNYPLAYLIENNVSMLREDWITLGLFSERLKTYGYIGREFFARAQYMGFKYQFAQRAGIVHHGEMEGDNGLTRKHKLRQARRAGFVVEALSKPHHFSAQLAWAKAIDEGQTPPAFPLWWPDLLLSLLNRAINYGVRKMRLLMRQ